MRIKKPYSYLLFLSLILLTVSCSETEETGLDSSVLYEAFDISYGSDALQSYDIYLPAQRSIDDTHMIVMIHGGGWVEGDKMDVEGLYDLVKIKMPNYGIINMNYRLTTKPDNPFSDQLNDVAEAINDLESKRIDYQISGKYALVGVSAGGHMALMHSYVNDENHNIKAVGNIIGPTYFLDDSYTMSAEPTLQILLASIEQITGTPITDEGFYNSLSPYSQVRNDSPPTIQFFGDQDPLIPNTQGPLLKEKLDELGIPNEITVYPGEGHGWTDLNNWNDTFDKFKVFVETHME